MKGRLLLGVALVAVVACTGAPGGEGGQATDGASVGQIRIEAPTSGSVISTRTIEVRGTAPAGARIVQDIPLAPDQDVIAGPDGRWSMTIELDEGENELVFRIGDDQGTAATLALTVKPASPATSSSPTDPPRPTDGAPTEAFITFGDGTWEVGTDIKPGTYRLREPSEVCYWARLKGFSGELDDVIANDLHGGYAVVTIKKSDAGFESNNCGEWSSDLSQVTDSRSTIDVDGTYIVGTDIAAGKWRSSGGDYCYWERLKAFAGAFEAIIANDTVSGGRTIVTIRSTDKGFATSGCGTWTRQ